MPSFLRFPATSLLLLCEPSGPCSWWLRQATIYTADGGEWFPLHCEETVSCCPRSHIQWVGKEQGLEGFEKKISYCILPHPPCHRRPGWCLDEAFKGQSLLDGGNICLRPRGWHSTI